MTPSYRHSHPDDDPDHRVHDEREDGPDILEGIAEDEPSLDDLHLGERTTPIRKPSVGKRLTAKELEADIGE